MMLSYDLESFSPPRTERDTPLQIKIFFINISAPFKRVIYALFPALLLCLLFLKIIMPERQILEWPILLPPDPGSPHHVGSFQKKKSGLQ